MLNRAKPLSNNNSWAEKGQRKSPKMKHSNRKGTLQKPLREEQKKAQLKALKKQHLENTDKWHLCKAGSFFVR